MSNDNLTEAMLSLGYTKEQIFAVIKKMIELRKQNEVDTSGHIETSALTEKDLELLRQRSR